MKIQYLLAAQNLGEAWKVTEVDRIDTNLWLAIIVQLLVLEDIENLIIGDLSAQLRELMVDRKIDHE